MEHQLIVSELNQIERLHHVSIIYAAETGGHIYGYSDTESDHDVKFIFKRKTEDYIRLDPPADVITVKQNGVFDIQGWDMKKALNLFAKSNASMYELLHSPLRYIENGSFAIELMEAAPSTLSLRRLGHHYRSMSKKNRELYLKQEGIKRLKTMLHSIRGVLVVRYMEEFRSLPPVAFSELQQGIFLEETISSSIAALFSCKLERKQPQADLEQVIDHFVSTELQRFEQLELPDNKMEMNKLNWLLLQELELGAFEK